MEVLVTEESDRDVSTLYPESTQQDAQSIPTNNVVIEEPILEPANNEVYDEF